MLELEERKECHEMLPSGHDYCHNDLTAAVVTAQDLYKIRLAKVLA